MPRELVNAKITHVSYVDKAANQKQFFFMKSDKQPDFQKEVKVLAKEAGEEKLVYGIVYEPDTVDAHGDFMTATEIEKAAHGFLKDARQIDKQHDFHGGVGEVVESYVAPADFEMNGETIKKGSWVLVTKASEEVWEQIKKGEITGYSMAGTAETIEKQKEKPVSQEKADEKGLFNLLKNFFTGKQQQVYEEPVEKAGRKFSASNLQEIKNAHTALGNLLSQVETEEEEEKMTSEEVTKSIQAALEPIEKRLETLEKEEELKKKNREKTEEDAEKKGEKLKKAISEAVQPLADRIEAIEKSRGTSKQTEESGSEQVQKSIWSGLF
ncbi:XkdF-like putative serine protease domain-containing protein [Bacillus inaquosorum]|uniref:XkdF-like putative serine protease domain-containing protein n=1 Tax=Bacillus inaquosorum TaxID=483913 RepID=UPI0022814F68|nr:XkdF-like putative serine protease domain-containing protein [Bacillus inaquosorum]MCY7812847.1 XkdF-like putative serine protease domain-containing protein [Bacillus spizizenii]MCY7821216.1 XkdF-like putative serine protease domain-containing protein [Bacillus inaquosorum]MCY7882232.1 XkdF-like putative serine protease domain-containing protein [Bacillus spizizenii]MCY7891227.1 XkdF-like putative serine protease domain-containing protein [Bacillus spizizenii]MCY7937225.1 XkdF-like putative